MGRRRKSGTRLYEKRGRWYADFRDFADVGGKREALIPEAESQATDDADLAVVLQAERLADLKRFRERRRDHQIMGDNVVEDTLLAEYALHHLEELKRAGRSPQWIVQVQKKLESAVAFFGEGRELRSIRVRDVQRWRVDLGRQKSGRTGPDGRAATLSPGTVHHYLSALSGLYTRAASEERVPPGYNPVGAMLDKPTGKPAEARWLEVPDAALLLEAARTFTPPPDKHALGGRDRKGKPVRGGLYPLLAAFLLTGGRKSEVLGLEVGDVNFDRKTVTFRPNDWRRLKTRTSHRVVPLWPQLEEILRAYVRSSGRIGGLLFPSERADGMVVDFDKQLDAIAERAGWKPGEVRSKMFRHTYCQRALADPRRWGSRKPVHRRPRARPRRTLAGGPRLWTPRTGAAPVGDSRIPN